MPYSLKQTLIALDQAANTLFSFGGDGYGLADETISARAWRLRDKSRWHIWIDRIFIWDKNHCEESFKSEMDRSQLPDAYKEGR